MAKLRADVKEGKANGGDGVARGLMRFFSTLLSDLRRCIRRSPGSPAELDRTLFLTSKPKAWWPVLKAMLNSQYFQQFLETRLTGPGGGKSFDELARMPAASSNRSRLITGLERVKLQVNRMRRTMSVQDEPADELEDPFFDFDDQMLHRQSAMPLSRSAPQAQVVPPAGRVPRPDRPAPVPAVALGGESDEPAPVPPPRTRRRSSQAPADDGPMPPPRVSPVTTVALPTTNGRSQPPSRPVHGSRKRRHFKEEAGAPQEPSPPSQQQASNLVDAVTDADHAWLHAANPFLDPDFVAAHERKPRSVSMIVPPSDPQRKARPVSSISDSATTYNGL